MKTFIGIFRELAGLFVEDGMLALAVGVVVALAAIAAAITPAVPIAPGVVLLAGCLGALFSNVVRAGKR